MNKISIKPLGPLAHLADTLMTPFMYLLSGSLEAPQLTHLWNNTRLHPGDVHDLDRTLMVHCAGLPNAMRRTTPVSHLQIFGGWRDYVVIRPVTANKSWHVGWIAKDVIGISRIELTGPVRLLLGPSNVSFFGLSAFDDSQVGIEEVGRGYVGAGSSYAKLPLL